MVCTNKNTMNVFAHRFEVTKLLLRLWARPGCRESIVHVCGKKKFQVHTCTCMYMHFTCTCMYFALVLPGCRVGHTAVSAE